MGLKKHSPTHSLPRSVLPQSWNEHSRALGAERVNSSSAFFLPFLPARVRITNSATYVAEKDESDEVRKHEC